MSHRTSSYTREDLKPGTLWVLDPTSGFGPMGSVWLNAAVRSSGKHPRIPGWVLALDNKGNPESALRVSYMDTVMIVEVEFPQANIGVGNCIFLANDRTAMVNCEWFLRNFLPLVENDETRNNDDDDLKENHYLHP